MAADVNYVKRTYFPDDALGDLGISKVTRLKQQRLMGFFAHPLKKIQYRDRLPILSVYFCVNMHSTPDWP